METLTLKVSTTQNKALNADGLTALRQLNLIQGETYEISLAPTPHQPAYDAFSFILRTKQGTANVAEVTGIASNAFILPLNTLAVNNALVGRDYGEFRAYLTWTESGQVEVIEPFNTLITATDNSIVLEDFVSSLNGLNSAVTITGAGMATVSHAGQVITIAANQTGDFATSAALGASGSALQTQIAILQGQTGDYYPRSNPSGYTTGVDLSNYATQAALNASGGYLQNEIAALQATTGSTPTLTDVLFTSGQQEVTGHKTFRSGLSASAGSGVVALRVSGQSGNNSDLTQWVNRSGAVLARITASGEISGDGSKLRNVVLTTGTQTVSGRKDFANGIRATTIQNYSAGTQVIDLDGKTLNGNWLHEGELLTESFSVVVNVSKIVPEVPGEYATVTVVLSNGYEGTTFSVGSSSTSTQVFELDSDTSVGMGNYAISFGDGTPDNYGPALASAITTYFTGYITASYDSGTQSITITGDSQSSSHTVTFDAYTDYGVSYEAATGTSDALAMTCPGGRKLIVTSITAFAPAGDAWTDCDIEVWYDTLTRIAIIPLAQLDGTAKAFYHGVNIFTDPSEYAYFANGAYATNLKVKTTVASGVSAESSGSAVYVVIKGYITY